MNHTIKELPQTKRKTFIKYLLTKIIEGGVDSATYDDILNQIVIEIKDTKGIVVIRNNAEKIDASKSGFELLPLLTRTTGNITFYHSDVSQSIKCKILNIEYIKIISKLMDLGLIKLEDMNPLDESE